ncbi:hypothetical protein JGH11_14700 [Dysgonomonas sp. Marseille-P4677]|uniref:hypothetical protein n=1 Tax=Dysgonomonas sp. Marseille-P4677 TaxID=2364790 RepID=UPI00191307B4|nr:hypothetical protein [Dysgonomonas sp. Marseille-P4677]MBK5722124.1 hypothetical protein [Dysgonomonas sp. Marseille-P4677]
MQKTYLTILLSLMFVYCYPFKILGNENIKRSKFFFELREVDKESKQLIYIENDCYSSIIEKDTIIKINSKPFSTDKEIKSDKLEGSVEGIINIKDSQSKNLFLSFKYINVKNDSIFLWDANQTEYIAYLPEKENFYKVIISKTAPPIYSIIKSDSLSLSIINEKIPSNYKDAFLLSLFPNEIFNYKYFGYKDKDGKSFFFTTDGQIFDSLNLLIEYHFGSVENYIQIYENLNK